MSNAKYTPAPWSANWNGYYYQIDTETDGRIGDACASQFIEGDTDKGKANALVMAAAPELLEALEKAKEHLEYCGYGDTWERECATNEGLAELIEKAIAKAKGES